MSIHNKCSWRNRSPEYRAGMLKKAHEAGLSSMYENGITNRQMTEQDAGFVEACQKAGIKATKRQASKYRRGLGAAYNAK